VTPLEWAVSAGQAALALLVLAGLVARRHVRVCVCFPLYLVSFVASESLVLAWGDRFWNLAFWTAKEALQGLLKFGVLLELVLRLFRNLPGARGSTAWLVFLVLLVSGAMLGASWDSGDLARVAIPALLYATAAGFTVLLLTVAWYHVPLHQVHKAILLGLTPYLFTFTVLVQALATWGWDPRRYANPANWVAYAAVLVYWVREAWRPYAAPSGIPRAVTAFLQPWAPQR
jgi:hypothetical protein